MREMPPDTENAFPSAYLCSECGWNFPLGRMSDLGDFFQQKSAVLSFADHDCGTSPGANNSQITRESQPGPDSSLTANNRLFR